MASTRSLVDYVMKQLGPGAEARAMFGEYGVYLGGVIIGLFCDDRLYLKVTDEAAAILGPHEREAPYPGGKPAIVVPEDVWDDRSLMAKLATTTRAALPPPKKKTAKKAAKNAVSTKTPARSETAVRASAKNSPKKPPSSKKTPSPKKKQPSPKKG